MQLQDRSPNQTPVLTEPKVTVFMPALNEQATIGENARAIFRALEYGLVDRFILVLDGCTDQSEERVRSELNQVLGDTLMAHTSRDARGNELVTIGCGEFILIVHATSCGKGASFKAGVQLIYEREPQIRSECVLVNIDADALSLLPSTAYRLARSLLEHSAPMTIGACYEQISQYEAREPNEVEKVPQDYAGFRGIRLEKLRPLTEGSALWHAVLPNTLCIEHALNLLLMPPVPLSDRVAEYKFPEAPVKLVHRPAGKHVSSSAQSTELRSIARAFSETYSGNLAPTT